ncbi:MAG: hypothetical protein EU547_06430, partial [Promethearchaeota archaeon]
MKNKEIRDVIKKDQAVSPIYNRMFYEWTGSRGLLGGGSWDWNGSVKYYYVSGNNFSVEYYDSYIHQDYYYVNNETRLISSIYSRWNNMHDIFWIFNNM